MLIQVYRYTHVTPSIMQATLVTEIDIDELPDDLEAFASEHDGDFIELTSEDD